MSARAGGRIGEHSFTLPLSGDVGAKLDDLYEAGCDDALIHSMDGAWYADFDREARNMEDAVASAVADVGKVGGVEVEGVAVEGAAGSAGDGTRGE